MKNQVQDNERYHDAVEPQYIEMLPMEYEYFEDKLSGWATIISCPVIEGASEDTNLKASVTFSNVDSLGEANQIMLALLDYLDSNPESKMNACLRIELNMYESYSIGSDSSVCFESIITYSGVDRIIEINSEYSFSSDIGPTVDCVDINHCEELKTSMFGNIDYGLRVIMIPSNTEIDDFEVFVNMPSLEVLNVSDYPFYSDELLLEEKYHELLYEARNYDNISFNIGFV